MPTPRDDAPVEPGALAAHELFEGLPEPELAAVAAQMRRVDVPVGEVLATEGELSSKAFVILDGALTVHRAGRHVADLGPGDVVGEAGTMGLLPRNATVIATVPSTLGVLMGWDLRELAQRHPAIRDAIESLAARRGAPA